MGEIKPQNIFVTERMTIIRQVLEIIIKKKKNDEAHMWLSLTLNFIRRKFY